MYNRGILKSILIWLTAAMVMLAVYAAVIAMVQPAGAQAAAEAVNYTRNATATDAQLQAMPGVYYTKAVPGDKKESATIGIPSVAKQALADKFTTESPAIIMGAARGFEVKTGPTDYMVVKKRVAPYKYFRYGIIEEQTKEVDGTITTHKKLSGFDGSFYIVRVDLTDLLAGIENPDGKYLHVKQEDNKALMVAVGFDGTTYSNGGNKTGSYSLKNNWAALKDDQGEPDPDKPYFDVIIYSSNKLASGADAGQQGALNGDIKLSFYVDGTEDYHPELVALDPNNMPTFPYVVGGVTYNDELAYNNALLTKYYEDDKVASGERAASYTVKGSDLEIDVMVEETETSDGVDEFWSLTKAMAYQPYDSHTIKLICEVPVLEGLSIQGESGAHRKVILDVNSFDIQIANNTEEDKAGLTINGNAELMIKDGSNTAGAELAIGNNATMVIKKNGRLVIDESCTNEVEYDAATKTDGTTPPEIFNGEITVEDGGTLINYGVVNIEGMESKPVAEGEPAPATSMATADMIVDHGGVFDNYGCLSIKGVLYVLGTLNNYGKYSDIIHAGDPDKGYVDYHKGIQVTWKDVVTKTDDTGKRVVKPGVLDIGLDAKGNVDSGAVLNNYGDIVLVPGTFNLRGTFNNTKNPQNTGYAGHLYLCRVTEAIIPIVPTQQDPLTVEKKVAVDPAEESVFDHTGGTVNSADGIIENATVELIHNGVLGELTPEPLKTAEDAIKALPDPQDITVGDKPYVEDARAKYDALPADYKAKVDHELVSRLQSAEVALAKAERDAAVDSKNKTEKELEKTAAALSKAKTAAGTEHKVKGSKVKIITNASAKKTGTVSFIKAKNSKSVSVPAVVTIEGKKFKVIRIDAGAFRGSKIRTVTVGSNVKKIRANAFSKSKATKLIIKTKKLTKKSVRGSLRGSKVKTVKVKLGKKSVNKKYVKKYKKIFTKKNAGRAVKVK